MLIFRWITTPPPTPSRRSRGWTCSVYMRNISLGTPGMATTVAWPTFIQMPGAVPAALEIASAPFG